MRRYRNYTDEEVIEAAKHVTTVAGLLRKLNLRPVGGNYYNIKRIIQRLNVDTSHWTGQAWCRDMQMKDWSEYTKSSSIKPHLIKERGHKCESCGLEEWLGKPITLELEHIDGNRTNNHLHNLKLLCPNCHSQTKTWRGRKNSGTGRETPTPTH